MLRLSNTGAGDRDRTGMASLEGWGSTIELHPQVVVLVVLSVGYRVGSREQKITLDSVIAPRGVA